MVRLADVPDVERESFLKKIPTLPQFPECPGVPGPALSERRVAIITTAGLHRRSDRPFGPGAAGTDYRVIPDGTVPDDLVMSQMSVNFDRSGFQADVNVVFPLERLRELQRDGVIGSVAAFHYSFMGAISPITLYEPKMDELADLLKADRVDAVVLSPV